MRQYLTATIQAASPDELRALIDPAKLDQIKLSDPHPEIRVYSIGHEGRSNLHLPGIGNKTITWVQAAIQWIKDKLEIGTAVFDRHDPSTNSHEGRVQIGEVVGKGVKYIGDQLNTLAAIYIKDPFKSKPLDVASIEAEMEFDHDEYQAWPVSIKHVSGIALSNSGIDTPGFPGATLVGAVQAYVQAFASDIGDNKMNLSDVKQAVKDLGLKPTQLFDVSDVMGDATVMAKVKEENKNVYNMSERLRDERDTARNTVAKLEGEKAEIDKTLKRQTMQSKSATVIEGILADPTRKLDDKAKAFIKRDLQKIDLNADTEEALKTQLTAAIDTSAKDYGELFGVADPNKPVIPEGYKLPKNMYVDTSKPPAVPGQAPVIPDPYPTRDAVIKAEMDPAVNPLIPGGKAALEALKT